MLLFSTLVLAYFGTGYGQNPSCVDVNYPGPERIFCAPGRILTAGITVTNRTSLPHRFASHLLLPQGIRRLTPDETFTVGPGQTDVRLVSIFIPVTQPAGPIVLRYSIQDSADGTCTSEADLVAFVKAVRSIEMKVATVPRFVIPGETSTIVFSVRNAGNEPSALLLSTTSADGMDTRLDSSSLRLEPGQTQLVRVHATPMQGISQHQKQVLQLQGILQQDSTVRAQASCQVETILRSTSALQPVHEIPVRATLRATGEDGRRGGQLEIEGGGTLTDGGHERVELFVRTPDVQSRSVLGYRDEYRLSYLSDQYDVHLGDRSYGLSPLTEVGRMAFGLEGEARIGDFNVGAFANQTRFYSPVAREQAGFLGYTIGEGSTVWANYLHKDEQAESNVGSARGIIRLFGRTDLDLEYGLSSMDGVSDRAYTARFHGGESLISYDLWYLHAGPDYGGYYRDIDSRTASFTFRPWRSFRFEGYVRDEDRNLLDDSLFATTAPRSTSYRLGAGYGEAISLSYMRSDERDRLPTPRFNRLEQSVELRSGFTGSVMSMVGTAEFGTTRDRLLDQLGNSQRYALTANFRPDSHQRYSISGDYSSQHTLFAWTLVERWSGSVSAGLTIGEGTQIGASLAATRYTTPLVQTITTGDVVVTHTLPFNHTITLRGRQEIITPGTDERDISWLVEYSIPFGVPVSRPSSTGALRGHVFDGVDMRGVPNIVLYAGDRAAITDEYGEFVFPALPPDRYDLRPDLGDIGMDRVTSVPMPRTVYVLGGEDTQTEIVLMRGATVSGAVRVFDFPEQAAVDSLNPGFIETGGQGNITIELASRTDTLRQLTDGRGQFRFGNVRAGEWTLRAVDGNIPPNHYLERDSVRFELTAGEKHETAYRVLPRKKVIRIIQEGKLDLVPPAPRPKPLAAPFTTVDGCVVSPTSSGIGYIVQVSVWTSRSAASKAAREIRKRTGIDAGIERGSGRSYRVIMGPFATELEAAAACTSARQAGQ